MTFENCILRRVSPTAQPIGLSYPSSSVVVTHCDIAGGWTGTGLGNFDLPPLFENSGSGDYRLRPGSPCVDAGMMPSDPTLVTDFEGDPRPLYGGYDVGYDECGDFALAPAAAGTVGLSATGQTVDILFVNGSTGGVDRHVDVIPGQPMTLSISLPVTHPPGADFVLYGYLGIADYKTVTSLPPGLPSMVFPPCDLFAAMSHPELFTLAGSVTGLSCPPAFFAPGGAPWSSGAIMPGVSGVTFGIQALIVEDLVGTIAASNAVEVRLL